MSTKFKTQFIKGAIDEDFALNLYNRLKTTIQWQDGIYSKINGFTRKASPLNVGEIEDVDTCIIYALDKLKLHPKRVYNYYLNYYENGEMYCPSHSHKGTKQLVISLGATRTLQVGTTHYEMSNGDVITFGASSHGIKKDSTVMNGRISIACFMEL
jgi:hypothetical protein